MPWFSQPVGLAARVAKASRREHNGLMNIRVVGAGAVGCLLGGLALEAGHEVTFSGSEEASRQLAAGGLRLVLTDRWVRLPRVRTVEQARRSNELTIVALKRHRLKELKRLPAARPPGELLFLNCEHEDARSLTPPGKEPMMGYTLLTSVMLEPGEAELASRRSCLLLTRHPLLEKLAAAWRAGGIEVQFVEEIEPVARSFFLWQLLFLPVALCHSTYEHFLSFAEGQRLAAGVLQEGLQIHQRLGRKLRRLPFMDPQELLGLIQKRPEELATARRRTDRAYNSMLQSILRGRKTEVRELNEKLVRMAAEAGVDPRWNWRLVQKLGRVAQAGFYAGPAELHRARE
jgi:2-dehydropantoate 2-reductase